MSTSLDDASSPTTTASLLRSFIGIHLRRIGGWIAVGDLVELISGAGVTENSTRSALSRLKGKRLLIPQTRDGRPGHLLDPDAVPMLERGDRRIYGYRQLSADDAWMLVLFSVPESERHLRHKLRTTLTWMGSGMVANGSWIGPGHLLSETRSVLAERGLLGYVTTMLARDLQSAGPLAAAVQQWWDLDSLRDRYREFLDVADPLARRWLAGGPPTHDADSDRTAFVDHLVLVDHWRNIPYLDPGLPTELLPAGWPGPRAVALFADLHATLAPAADRHVSAVLQR